MVTSGAKSIWRPVTRVVPKGSMLDPVLFIICINDLDVTAECTLCQFAEDTKLGGVADVPEGRAANQRDLCKLEKWAARNLMKFSKEKYQILHLGRNNPRHPYRQEPDQLEGSFAERALAVPVGTR